MTGNRENNLKNIDVEFPLGCMTVGTLSYWFIGYGLMYGSSNGWIATSDIFFNPGDVIRDGGVVFLVAF